MGAAIVAGIEAGWVNPVINKVIAHLFKILKWNIIVCLCQEYMMDQAAQVHHDIIHSKGAKGKLVLKVSDEWTNMIFIGAVKNRK